MFSDVSSFAYCWDRCYPPDENNVHEELLFKDQLTEAELLKLYELKFGKLSDERLTIFSKEIVSHLQLINELKESVDISMYYHHFPDIEVRWHIFLMRVIFRAPIFDENVYRAYHFIRTAEKREPPIQEEEEYLMIYHDFFTFFWNTVESTPDCTPEQLNNALWAFGKFLKDYERMFF